MPERLDLTELGSSGLRRAGGFVQDEFLPQLTGSRGRALYREAAENDPVIGSFLFAIEKIILRLDWRVEPFKEEADDEPTDADAEVAAFIDGALNDMSDSWDATVQQVLSMLVYGWSWHEIVYKRRVGPDEKDPSKRSQFTDNKVGWRKWAIRGQDTLVNWVFDDHGGIQAMVQLDPSTGQGATMPIEKSLLFRTTAMKGNPEGRSVLRNAMRSYVLKKRIEEIEAVGIERDLAGLPVAWVPPEWLSADATSDQKRALTTVQDLVTAVKRGESEGVVFPVMFDGAGNRVLDLTLLSTGGSRQFNIDATVARYDQRIAMTTLSDFILLGHERVGSFALGVSKVDLWTMAVDAIARSIAEVVNQYAIPRLMRLNGMDTARAPELGYGNVESVNLTELGDYITKLSQAGVMAADDSLEEYLRTVAGLPQADPESAQQRATDKMAASQTAMAVAADQKAKINEKYGVKPEEAGGAPSGLPPGTKKEEGPPNGEAPVGKGRWWGTY